MEMMSSFLLEVGPILVLSNELHPSVLRGSLEMQNPLSVHRGRSPPEEKREAHLKQVAGELESPPEQDGTGEVLG